MGIEIDGLVDVINYVIIMKYGFVLGFDINNYNSMVFMFIEMDFLLVGMMDYDMLENVMEVDGVGYFIFGFCNVFFFME